MVWQMMKSTVVAAVVAGFLHVSSIAMASTGGEAGFYQAYYLETQQGDWKAAAKLYEDVLKDARLDEGLRAQARTRLASCREELASADFASLVPAHSLAYVEFSRPGKHVEGLLRQLGLLREGPIQTGQGLEVGVSPTLVHGLIGLRGAAAAVTGFDPVRRQPSGVVILHPGELDILRGLLETGLPVGGQAVEPIQGFPTYDVESEALVTLTHRLVIASTQRAEIEGVIARLTGKDESSLRTHRDVAEELAQRGDAMVFFCLNARPVMGLVNMMLAAGSAADPQVALVRALLDPNSLQTLVGKMGVSDAGLTLDLSLRLNEGHKNLVYNFLRTPAIHRETLRSIPSGAAAFVAGALNPPPAGGATKAEGGAKAPIVTALDLGRELFGNIATVAAFVLAADKEEATQGFIPDVGIVLTVNDPGKSEALWTQMLGLASLATGSGAMEGSPAQVGGVKARSFTFPNGVRVLFAAEGHEVLIASNENVLSRSLAARREKSSVLDDPAYAESIGAIMEATTKAVFAHPGRLARLAERFASASERAELAKAADVLTKTVVMVLLDHTADTLHLGLRVTGIPDVGPLVGAELAAQRTEKQREQRLAQAIKQQKWDTALSVIDEAVTAQPGKFDLIERRCKILALKKKDREAAEACFVRFGEAAGENANAINNLAWALLTEERFGQEYDASARMLAEQACQLTEHRRWAYLDTLALAEFRAGDAAKALEHQREAVRLAGSKANDEMKAALTRYEAAAQAPQLANSGS